MAKSSVQCTREAFERYVQRFADKDWDWTTFAGQAEHRPELKRAQIRMVGGSITGVYDEPGTIPAEHFTVSFMKLPPGNLASSHAHPDCEEAFFILHGRALAWWEDADTGEQFQAELGPHDLVMSPAHVLHGIKNIGEDDLIVQVLIGAQRPQKPYFTDEGLSESVYAVHGQSSTATSEPPSGSSA